MHTTFCDGANTPEEMVLSAIDKGMECIGFSGHSFVEFDLACGMDKAHEAGYFAEISRLKKAYEGRIRIYCGLEQDYFSATPDLEYDYKIGSVHYLQAPVDNFPRQGVFRCLPESRNKDHKECASETADDTTKSRSERHGGIIYGAVDDTPEKLVAFVEKYFNNDFYAAAESYFAQVANVIRQTGADIIGHFDLISKFNEKCCLFDELHPRYIAAWQQAVDALLATGKVFEINTGAISRGWRSVPYPAPPILDYLCQKGAGFILSSDSHKAETIGYGFDEYRSHCANT